MTRDDIRCETVHNGLVHIDWIRVIGNRNGIGIDLSDGPRGKYFAVYGVLTVVLEDV